jgi:lipid-A-disaccharide synthase-like uncharacterized protein
MEELWASLRDPGFFFGMAAQFAFFLRFFVQWVISEKRRRSTMPIAFWYFSLAGGLMMFVYAVHRAEAVFMLGQLFACFIYLRNLMLIYGHRRRVQQGLAATPDGRTQGGEPPMDSEL